MVELYIEALVLINEHLDDFGLKVVGLLFGEFVEELELGVEAINKGEHLGGFEGYFFLLVLILILLFVFLLQLLLLLTVSTIVSPVWLLAIKVGIGFVLRDHHNTIRNTFLVGCIFVYFKSIAKSTNHSNRLV